MAAWDALDDNYDSYLVPLAEPPDFQQVYFVFVYRVYHL